jgi:GIY-YIG catalytic domain
MAIDCNRIARGVLLRDRLQERLRAMGASPDYPRLAAEVLGVRNAPPELARRLVSQALVIEDRREAWQAVGQRIAAAAPPSPGVYVLRDSDGAVLYIGKTINLRRRLRTHFAARRWNGLKAPLARAADAEWTEVGSELEGLLREAVLIRELQPVVNVQTGPPAATGRMTPPGLVRDVLVVLPSIDPEAVELAGARVDGGWLLQRTSRSGRELAVHARRMFRFFHSPLRMREDRGPLAPLVFSWLAGRGASATRLDPHDAPTVRALSARLKTLFADERLFTERLVVR